MKARIKETGEIINISDYARVTLDKCDSYGSPIELSFDEVEILQERSDNIDWEQRRYELAKSAMQGYCIALGINDDSETYDDIAIGSLRVFRIAWSSAMSEKLSSRQDCVRIFADFAISAILNAS